MSPAWLGTIYASSVEEVDFDECHRMDTEQNALPTSAGKLRSVKLHLIGFLIIVLCSKNFAHPIFAGTCPSFSVDVVPKVLEWQALVYAA